MRGAALPGRGSHARLQAELRLPQRTLPQAGELPGLSQLATHLVPGLLTELPLTRLALTRPLKLSELALRLLAGELTELALTGLAVRARLALAGDLPQCHVHDRSDPTGALGEHRAERVRWDLPLRLDAHQDLRVHPQLLYHRSHRTRRTPERQLRHEQGHLLLPLHAELPLALLAPRLLLAAELALAHPGLLAELLAVRLLRLLLADLLRGVDGHRTPP
ncbi:hypothetical protein ACF08N_33930 [Streptomyces sp. NPDC015127]|uniref:hypothetical protein n=1 Tax=Streptomyces sp. NPDC015127 TaxID=3364939 RepID=UPI0036F97779